MISGNKINFHQFAVGFEKLKAIAFRDIVVNEWCVRVLGAHFMDNGPDWTVKKHKHSFFEFHYVLQGDVYTNLNGKEFNVKAGQFYLMSPGTVHSHHQRPGTNHIGFSLRWEVSKVHSKQIDYSNTFSEFERINSSLFGVPVQPVNDDNGMILYDINNLLEMTKRNRFPIHLQLAFLEVIIHLAGLYLHKSSEQEADCNQQTNESFLENHIVDNAIHFIEENYMQAIDVSDVSSSAHLSYSHLSRLFKKYTGETIIYHINKARLYRAQRLLLCTDKSISQIAEEVGFNNKNYFCTIFKKFFHISPGNYRSKINKLSE